MSKAAKEQWDREQREQKVEEVRKAAKDTVPEGQSFYADSEPSGGSNPAAGPAESPHPEKAED
jgi:hypothetical protein